ncbi:hypothetical protein [Aequorivita sp. CIP111184]|uniref:hypothetical protein n=1 Tax=Aequorivita sp. CIP111184 TaxID=2211356 RepID=UPI000DBC3568|nr:hypothetical protein [Aequorivita sp. CIP111184]SRX56076.1 hypothetical protein AEQU1_03103 [Aequorivita sp. CIP111184]
MFWNIDAIHLSSFLIISLAVKGVPMKNSLDSNKKDDVIYMSIDHLKQGKYELKILLNNKVMKSIKILKE